MIRLISPRAVLCHCIVNLFTSFSALCLIRQLFNTNNGLALWVLQQSGQCSGSSRHYYSVCLHVSVWEITHHIDQDNRLNLTTAIIKQAQLLSQNHNKEIKILFKENDTLLTIIHISNIKVIHFLPLLFYKLYTHYQKVSYFTFGYKKQNRSICLNRPETAGVISSLCFTGGVCWLCH